MKLKLIAAAAALAVFGGAHATPHPRIDQGLEGSGDFFFTIWDQAGSFIADLQAMDARMTQDGFTSALAAPGLFSAVFNLGADSNFQSFMRTANQNQLQWNIRAVERVGGVRLHTTHTAGTLPALAQTRINGTSTVSGIQDYLGRVNTDRFLWGPAPITSAVFTSAERGWAGNRGCTNAFTTQHYSNCGTLANNSYGTGLGMMLETYAPTGTARGAFNPLFDGGFAVNAWIDGGNLQVAAVPEPGVYAMLLAGLGLMGAIARRRQNKA